MMLLYELNVCILIVVSTDTFAEDSVALESAAITLDQGDAAAPKKPTV
jgi:hypothetical protein